MERGRFDRFGRLIVEIEVRPLTVPPELLPLDPESEVLVREAAAGFSTEWAGKGSAGEAVEYIRAKIRRQNAGRYTVCEAAQILADENEGRDAKELLAKMKDAFTRGDLCVRDDRDGFRKVPSEFWPSVDVVHVSELRAWLESEGARYTFPASATAPIAPSQQRVPRRHRIGGDVMAPVIDRACSAVANPADSAAVMAELEKLARLPEKERPAPLAGVTYGGVQWHNGGARKTLTRRALGDRLRRRARPR